METITLHSRVGADGLLKLLVPVKLTNTDLDVVVIVQPAAPAYQPPGWPVDFFERTYGSFRDQPLVRESQGDYEIREKFDADAHPANEVSPCPTVIY